MHLNAPPTGTSLRATATARSNMHGASHVYAVEVAQGPRSEHARLATSSLPD